MERSGESIVEEDDTKKNQVSFWVLLDLLKTLQRLGFGDNLKINGLYIVRWGNEDEL